MKRIISLSKVMDASAYKWYRYGVGSISLKSAKGIPLVINKGDRFGIRASSDGKKIRLVAEKTGLTKVFTITESLQASLLKNSGGSTLTKAQKESAVDEDMNVDATAEGVKEFKKLLSKAVGLPNTFDLGLVKWLRGFGAAAKLANSGKEDKAIQVAMKLVTRKIVSNRVKACDNKEAIAAAKLILTKSVPSQLRNALSYDEVDMLFTCLEDCTDHMELACALYAGNLKKAEDLRHMDTASRDELPDAAWNYMMTMFVPRIDVVSLRGTEAGKIVRRWALRSKADFLLSDEAKNWQYVSEEFNVLDKNMKKFDGKASFYIESDDAALLNSKVKELDELLKPTRMSAKLMKVGGDTFLTVSKKAKGK